jgi:hypothetical protein
VLAVALSLVADSFLLPLAVRGFVRVIELLMNACVWLALSLGVGMSAWSVLGVIGRAAAGMVMTRQASAALTVVMAVGVLAAYGLQRMLVLPEDSGKAAGPGTSPNNRTKEELPR